MLVAPVQARAPAELPEGSGCLCFVAACVVIVWLVATGELRRRRVLSKRRGWGERAIMTRYNDHCADCGAYMPVGSRALWKPGRTRHEFRCPDKDEKK